MLPEDLIIRADLKEKKGGRNRIIEKVMHFPKISSRMESMKHSAKMMILFNIEM